MDTLPNELFNGQVKFVDVKFVKEWMGHPRRSTMKMDERQAGILISRGTVKIFEPAEKKERPVRRLRKKTKETPDVDKMVKVAGVKK